MGPVGILCLPCIWEDSSTWAKSRRAAITQDGIFYYQAIDEEENCGVKYCNCGDRTNQFVPIDQITDLTHRDHCECCFRVQTLYVTTPNSGCLTAGGCCGPDPMSQMDLIGVKNGVEVRKTF